MTGTGDGAEDRNNEIERRFERRNGARALMERGMNRHVISTSAARRNLLTIALVSRSLLAALVEMTLLA